MPNVNVRLPQGALTSEQQDALGASLTHAVHEAEGIPSEAGALTWVWIEEVSRVFIGGAPTTLLPVVVEMWSPHGVLDATRRAVAARRIHEAVASVLGDRARTSCLLLEVPEGHWGGQGGIWGVREIAQVARFEHIEF